jgi:hypothetical protein
MNNRAQNKPPITLALPDLIGAVITALQLLGIEISPNMIDNNGKLQLFCNTFIR